MPKEGVCRVFPNSRPALCEIISRRLKDIKDVQRHRMSIISVKWDSYFVMGLARSKATAWLRQD